MCVASSLFVASEEMRSLLLCRLPCGRDIYHAEDRIVFLLFHAPQWAMERPLVNASLSLPFSVAPPGASTSYTDLLINDDEDLWKIPVGSDPAGGTVGSSAAEEIGW